MAGQFSEPKRYVALNAEVSILQLGVGPGQLEGTMAHVGVPVLGNEPEEVFAGPRRESDEVDLPLLPGVNGEAPPNHEYRVKHITLCLIHRHGGIAPCPSPSESIPPVCLELKGLFGSGAFCDQLRHPDGLVVWSAQPPPCQQGLQLGQCFGLDEQFIEGWVSAVHIVRGQAQFNGRGQLQFPRARPVVD